MMGPISPPGGSMFHRAGATAEKAHLLDPARWNSLTDGVRNMPSLHDWVGRVNVMGMRWSLR